MLLKVDRPVAEVYPGGSEMAVVQGMQGQGTSITKRIDTDTVWRLLNQEAVGREDYLERFEAGYNLGPAACG